ncbi:MFS transporter [Flexivirga endophytica]|uniref:MFS transporter n=2 Tax=Flexivirga endophytica TaxID=1849103 RepID=A0A916TIL4_9MICO|nr:MFS transporter [Flexivirga endophytica]GHB67364.1 MFS transporter [Flexivirga endophytica]
MTLIGVVLLEVLVAFEQIAVATAMPTAAKELDGLAIYPVVFAVPLATAVLAMVIAGPWADAIGPRVVVMTGVGLFVGGLLIAGSAQSMTMLIIGRSVQSVGGGFDSVALYVLIAMAFPETLRPKIFMSISAAWVAPSLFGPPLAGYLATNVSWRWVFWIGASLAIPALVLLLPAMRRLPDVVREQEPAVRVRRRLVAAGAAALGSVALSVAADRPMLPAVVLAIGGLVLLVVSVPKLVPPGTIRGQRGMPSIIATRALLGAAFLGTDIYLPLMLTRQHGMGATEAGVVLTVGALSWSLGAWIAGRRSTYADQRRLARTGLVLLTIGISVALSAAWPTTPSWVLYGAWLVGGGGIGLAYSPLTVLLMGMSAPDEQGRNASSLQTAEMLTTSVLLAVSAIVFGGLTPHSHVAAFVSGLVLAILAALLGVVVSHRLEPVTPARAAKEAYVVAGDQ